MPWKYAGCADFAALVLAFPASAHYPSVGFPVVNHLYGEQAEPDWRLLTGIAVSF